MKKEISIKEAMRRAEAPGEHYGQYIHVNEDEISPCNCRIPNTTQYWKREGEYGICLFCGRKFKIKEQFKEAE